MSVFRFIAAEKANYPISQMCRVLGVSRSGFHAWERRAPSDRALADAWLSERISRSTRRAARPTAPGVSIGRFGTVRCGSAASGSSG